MNERYETAHRGGGDSPYGPYELDLRPELVNYYLVRAREERARACADMLKAAVRGVRRLVHPGALHHPDIHVPAR